MNAPTDMQRFAALAGACKALSHPARLALLDTLAKKGECICGELVEVMPLSQSTVSQHLKVLKTAGLVTGEIDGPRSCYCIDWERMRELRGQLEQLFGALESCC